MVILNSHGIDQQDNFSLAIIEIIKTKNHSKLDARNIPVILLL